MTQGRPAVATTTELKPPAEMTTPALVREYGDRRAVTAVRTVLDALNGTATSVTTEDIGEGHDRHVAVCTELRHRGVLN
jgi:hypothetical protein